MRILLLCPMPPDRKAPGATPPLLHAALTGLRASHRVTVACVCGPDPAELRAAERLRAEGMDVHAAVRRPGSVVPRARRAARWAKDWLLDGLPWRAVWYREPGMQRILDGLFAAEDFDIVAVEDDAAAVYDLPARVPRVLTEHEVRRSLPPSAGRLARIDHRRWPSHQRRVCARFDLVGVFTMEDARELEALAPQIAGRVRIVPFGIELPLVDAAGGEIPESVLFAGNYTHPPNVDAALWLGREIAPRLRALRPQARVRIAGIHAPPEVRALAGAGIEVLGAVPDLDREIARSALVLAPLRTGGGMRMKVLHALACGAAVVTTPLGSLGLAEHERPPLAVASDADGLAAAAAGLLADEPARRALGARARAFVERHHAPEPYARRLETLYREAIAMHGRHP